MGKRLRVLVSDDNAGIDDELIGGVIAKKSQSCQPAHPALHPGIPFVEAAPRTVPPFEHAETTSQPVLCPCLNQRFFCLRPVLLVERLGTIPSAARNLLATLRLSRPSAHASTTRACPAGSGWLTY